MGILPRMKPVFKQDAGIMTEGATPSDNNC